MEFQEIAEQIITKNLRIRARDQVLITSWEHTIPLAEALAVACYRVGAKPDLRLFTDGLYRQVLSEMPDEVLRLVPTPLLAAYDHFSATIELSGPKDPAVFEGSSPARMAAMYDADRPIEDKARERKIRGAWIMTGNTPERARQYGIDHRAWGDFISEALSVDPSELASVGQQLANVLRGGKRVRITGSGTDLTVNLIGRQPQVKDGIVDEQDLAIGNRLVFLPTGYVGVAPDESSANGTITFPFAALWGKVVRDLQWTFANGRLTAFSARENEGTFRTFFESATGDKDRLGSLGIGINPRAKALNAGGLTDWLVEGAFTVLIGKNKEWRGELESSLSWFATITGPRVEIDGRVVAENGRVLV